MEIPQINNVYRTLPAICEGILHQLNSGITNIDTRFDTLYIQQMVIAASAELKKTAYTGSRGMAQNHYIPQICKQEIILEWDANLNLNNDDCWNRFRCPDVISLDDERNGFTYIGNKKGNNNFMIIRSEEQYAEYLNDAIMSALLDKHVLAMYDGAERVMKLRDVAPDYKDIKGGKVRAVLSNPLDCPSYNYDTDIFPLDSNSLNTVVNAVYTSIRLSAYGKPDEVADGSDQSQQAQLSRFLANSFIRQSNPALLNI